MMLPVHVQSCATWLRSISPSMPGRNMSIDGSPKVLMLMQTGCGMAPTQAAIARKKSGKIEKCEIAVGRIRVRVNLDLRTPSHGSEMTTHGVVVDIAATARTADALSIFLVYIYR